MRCGSHRRCLNCAQLLILAWFCRAYIMELFYTVFIVLLLILLAIVVAAQQVANPGGESPASFSGAGEQPARGCGPRCAPAQAPVCKRVCNHQVGNALYYYAHNLDPSSNITGRRDGGQYTGGGQPKRSSPGPSTNPGRPSQKTRAPSPTTTPSASQC